MRNVIVLAICMYIFIRFAKLAVPHEAQLSVYLFCAATEPQPHLSEKKRASTLPCITGYREWPEHGRSVLQGLP